MPNYYPLSQIQTNLYTNGREYALISNIDPKTPSNTPVQDSYKGPYFKTSDGGIFSGKVPTNESERLIPLDSTTLIPQLDDSTPLQVNSTKAISIVNNNSTDDPSVYNSDGQIIYPANTSNYVSDSKGRLIPSPYYPVLTQEQKDEGQFTRYFTKRANELRYIETDKKTYDALETKNDNIAWDLYEPAFLIWKIKGDKQEVYKSNKASAMSVEQQFRWPGFPKYFKDRFTQFYLED